MADPAQTRQAIQWPSIGLIVTAVLSIIWALLDLAAQLFGFSIAMLEDMQAQQGEMLPIAFIQGISIVSDVIWLGIGAYTIWAALQIRELRGYKHGVIASILAVIPLCTCCCTGLPFGIWALIVLLNSQHKEAFTS